MKFIAALLMAGIAFVGIVSPVSAFEGGGRKPSEAPPIAFGQHYISQLNNHKSDANYNGEFEVALYRLPPVGAHDLVVVNWHVLPFTHRSGFPVCMALVQNVDDFSWGTAFGKSPHYECGSSGPAYAVSGSGTAQTNITVQETNSNATYLEFWSRAEEETPSSLETYPYDFTVDAPRHFLGLAITPKTKVHANGAISAAVTLANGLPAPDGLVFNLAVTWPNNGIATYAAPTSGGRLTFPLALPESAVHERASFVVSRGTDGEYQGVGGSIRANVTPAVESAAEVACAKARQRSQVLARQFKRLKRHVQSAQGRRRTRLRHQAHRIHTKWEKARSQARGACASL
ncbi:MAG TPA: hypothetical protein VGO24_02540 [Solirubrobacterales bacterium]|jgi:hypothetical protein|nr:hypothetical protein [Solirubrobacterales bacterium]